jgi:hypothetical protein
MGGMKTKPKVAAEIVLHHNPKAKMPDGASRGKTILPQDRNGPTAYQPGPNHPMGRC